MHNFETLYHINENGFKWIVMLWLGILKHMGNENGENFKTEKIKC